jgi:hypothetical protein
LNRIAYARPMQVYDDQKRPGAVPALVIIIGPQPDYLHVRAEILERFGHALAREALCVDQQNGARRLGFSIHDDGMRRGRFHLRRKFRLNAIHEETFSCADA